MKKLLILLSIILLTRITVFSSTISTEIEQDSIVYITSTDLKYANLIFAEHDKFLNENAVLKTQISNYRYLNKILTGIDSLRLSQIQEYSQQVNNLEIEIKAKNRTIKYWQIGGITVSIGLILLLLCK